MKISPQKYAQALFELTKDKNEEELKKILASFGRVLRERGDLKKIDEIIDCFEKIWNKEHKIKNVDILTPYKLDKESFEVLNKYLSRISGVDNIKIQEKIDKKIIGGFIIKDGDKIYDASLKTKIDKLKKQLEN